jgi:hypothetical protein
MYPRSLVTLSSENGLSRFRPSPDTTPAAGAREELRKGAHRGDPSLPPSPAHNLGRQPCLVSGNAEWRSTNSGRRSGRW